MTPAGTSALQPGTHLVGRVRPARHFGSVDVFLEAIEAAEPGDVLAVDNGGRLDEACVGDLVALEAARAGLSGLVIWGLHRDSADLRAIALPVLSLGALPAGPQRLDAQETDALEWADIGEHRVTPADVVVGDDDGAVFVPGERAEEIARVAAGIRDTERRQAAAMRLGTSLRSQTDFAAYLTRRRDNPTLTFRQHLRAVGGAIEE